MKCVGDVRKATPWCRISEIRIRNPKSKNKIPTCEKWNEDSMTPSPCITFILLTSILFLLKVDASSLLRTTAATASIRHTRRQRIREQNLGHGRNLVRGYGGSGSIGVREIQFASRRSRSSTPLSKQAKESEPPENINDQQTVGYNDLSLTGKIIAGFVEVSVVVVFDYIIGFFGGYVLGTLRGLPGLASRVHDKPSSRLMQVASGRLLYMHQRSARWGRSWGGVNAVVGGFGTSARVIRGGVDDEWTTLLSSMAMGAFFSRQSKTRERFPNG